MRTLLLALLALTLACGDDVVVPDAGADLGTDAFTPPPDLGPPCELECAAPERCCLVDGRPTCVDTRNDENHCGGCGVVCAEGRGTRCENSVCVCGSARMGCVGAEDSFCCPPVGDRTNDYCANFREDPRDCGGCGIECDPRVADRCGGGRCVCGAARAGCDGTDESTCCRDAFGMVECRDLTTDRFHCGECENVCELSESCANGNCTVGPDICEERCSDTAICCGGVCCRRGACIAGVCGGPDAAAPDAGVIDGGTDEDGGGPDGGA